jgi:hypothetical protein
MLYGLTSPAGIQLVTISTFSSKVTSIGSPVNDVVGVDECVIDYQNGILYTVSVDVVVEIPLQPVMTAGTGLQ